MEKYNYLENVKNDVKTYIEENINLEEWEDKEELEETLNVDLWVNDSVTGNASGSYTFNTWVAEENICHNWDLMGEVSQEFGMNPDSKFNAEYWDVSIRCYLLPTAISEVLDELL